MATFALGGGKMKRWDVKKWVINKSTCYKLKGTPDLALRNPAAKGNWLLEQNIDNASNDYNLPLTPCEDSDPEADSVDLRNISIYANLWPCFRACTRASRIYLQRALGNELQGSPKLLELPKELRLTVYEMCLSFPAALKLRNDKEQRNCVYAKARAEDQCPKLPERWSSERDWFSAGLCIGSIHIVLALLSVNKQIHREAKGIFRAQNQFILDYEQSESWKIARLSGTGTPWLKSIGLVFGIFSDPDWTRKYVDLYRLLLEVSSLERVVVRVLDHRSGVDFSEDANIRATPCVEENCQLGVQIDNFLVDAVNEKAREVCRYVREEVTRLRARSSIHA